MPLACRRPRWVDVKITRIVTRPLRIPYREPFHWAQGVIENAEVILVEVHGEFHAETGRTESGDPVIVCNACDTIQRD